MDSSRKRLFIALAIVFAVVAIFLAGYLPGRSRARAASGETERVSDRLRESQATLAQTQFAAVKGRLAEMYMQFDRAVEPAS